MTQFLTQDSLIPPYMAFPRFLLDKDGLSESAKILYIILFNRARLSQKNDGRTDEQGHVFIFFPMKNTFIGKLEQQHITLSEQKEADKAQFLEIQDGIAPENKDAVMAEREAIRKSQF